jgi:EAL domain-containing protein (putative c-di-GMP-specific phosphodiesterase class I)
MHPLSRVVAEGVETREQLDFLVALKSDEAQGYFFSKPVVPDELAELLRTGVKDIRDWSGQRSPEPARK